MSTGTSARQDCSHVSTINHLRGWFDSQGPEELEVLWELAIEFNLMASKALPLYMVPGITEVTYPFV